jgi:hypothetical protein
MKWAECFKVVFYQCFECSNQSTKLGLNFLQHSASETRHVGLVERWNDAHTEAISQFARKHAAIGAEPQT